MKRRALRFQVVLVALHAALSHASRAYAEESGSVPSASTSIPVTTTADGSIPVSSATATVGESPGNDLDAGKLEHETAPELHKQALALLRAGKFTRAAEGMRRLVEREPKSAEYVTDWGYVLLKQGKWAEAEVQFRKAILLDSSRPYAYIHCVDSVLKQPNRWEKRDELLDLLETARKNHREKRGLRFELELLEARVKFEFGLLDQAKKQVSSLQVALKEADPGSKEVTLAQRRKLDELTRLLSFDTRARSLQDWPEPQILPEDVEQLRRAESDLKTTNAASGQEVLGRLRDKYPAWQKPRRLLAERLAAQGRYDEAVSELTVLTRLAPSDPYSHKQLGLLLAAHGGALSAARADEALAIALSLEPEWSDLQGIRDTLKARKVTLGTTRVQNRSARRPSETAVQLHDQALELLQSEPPDEGGARALLEQALRESPAFAAAAATLFSLTRSIHKPTAMALWNDPEGLFGFYQELRRLDSPPPAETLSTYLERSIELGSQDALFARALVHQRRGDTRAAVDDLARYLATVTDVEKLETARSLRYELSQRHAGGSLENQDLELRARLHLQDDDPEGALKILGAPCQTSQSAGRLLALAMVYERQRDDPKALGCYELALERPGADAAQRRASVRAARLLARTDARLLDAPVASRLASLTSIEPAAYFAMSRQARGRGDGSGARKLLEQYLAKASEDDTFTASARAQLEAYRGEDLAQISKAQKRRSLILYATWLAVIAIAFAIYRRLLHGLSLLAALRRKPTLYPEFSRLISELRHDVLKHRVSALGLLKNFEVTHEQLLPALTEPSPASLVVAQTYAELRRVARSERLELRRLEREPCFGKLHDDLKAVERLLKAAAGTPGGKSTAHYTQKLLELDQRFGELHAKNLKLLLSAGPSCEVDAATLQRWSISGYAEQGTAANSQLAPALSMSDLRLKFPLEERALQLIFANLFRNAQAAIRGLPDGAIVIVVRKRSDFAGQTLVELLVGDNAPQALTARDIETRDPSRGLGIVRETTRHWRGRVVVRDGEGPYTKYVGAEFSQ